MQLLSASKYGGNSVEGNLILGYTYKKWNVGNSTEAGEKDLDKSVVAGKRMCRNGNLEERNLVDLDYYTAGRQDLQ